MHDRSVGAGIPEERVTHDRAIRVVIADDHQLIRDSLKKVLGLENDIKVIGEAGNGREALERVWVASSPGRSLEIGIGNSLLGRVPSPLLAGIITSAVLRFGANAVPPSSPERLPTLLVQLRRDQRGPDPRRIFVFQERGVFPWLTVEGNIGFGLFQLSQLTFADLQRWLL